MFMRANVQDQCYEEVMENVGEEPTLDGVRNCDAEFVIEVIVKPVQGPKVAKAFCLL